VSKNGRNNEKVQNQKDKRRRSRHGLSSDGRATVEAHKNKVERMGRSCLAFDMARCEGIYMQD